MPALAVALFSVFASLLAVIPRVTSDPWVTANGDGTSDAVWNFSNPGDYVLTNTQISGGAGLLASAGPGVQYWNSTTAGDFAGPDSATNVDFTSSPGDVMLATTSGASTLLVLQPAATGEDSWLEEFNPTTTHGAEAFMSADGTGSRRRPVLRFDLSSLPVGAVIDGAVLYLYQYTDADGTSVVISVHEVIASWTEADVTWDDRNAVSAWASPGGDYDPHVIAQATIDAANNVWRSWNITQLADLWYRGVRPNNGLILVTPSAAVQLNKDFRSSDYGVAAERPRLEIRYRILGATGEYVSQVLGPGTPTAWQTISWNPSVRSLVADEFNGASLDPKWTWLNAPASFDVGTTLPGNLHVVSTANSQIDGATFTGNALWNDVVGDFSAEMKFSSSPTASSNRVGLMALLSQRDWFSVGKHYSGGVANWMTRETVDAVTTTIFNGASGNPIPAWVRLVRTGNTFDAWTSSDGTAWTLRDTYAPSDQYPLAIRLAFYIAHGAAGSGFSADVDYIRVTHGAGATVSVSTRTGDTNPVDGTWSGWSASYPLSSGSAMAGTSNFVEYRLSFAVSTASPDHRPVVGDVNMTSGTASYVAAGTIETNDLVPADLQQWGTLTVADAPNGQTVSYEYSLNSGGSWTPVVPPADLSGVSVASGRIRFRVSLSTSDSQFTPTVSEIRLTYTHRLDHFYVTAWAAAAAGAPFSVTVTAKDAANATILSWTGTVTLAARLLDGITPGNGILGTTSLVISAGGTATLATENYTRTETIRIHASFGAQEGLSGPVLISPGPIVRVVVAPPSVTLLPFASQSFTATAFDAWDNPVPGAVFAWIVTNGVGTLNTSSGPTVTLTAQPPDGANGTLEATASGVTGVALITVGIPSLDHFYVTASASAAAGAPFSVTVTAKDATNNTIMSWNGTVTLAARLLDGITPGNGILGTTSLAISAGGTATLATENYTRAETIRIHASFGAPEGLSGPVVITPGPIARVAVAPPVVTVLPFTNQSFTASAFDAWDNPVPGAAFTWVVTNGVGTLNTSAGTTVTMTAQPPVGAIGTVEATASGITGVAAVTVGTPTPPWVVITAPNAGASITGTASIAYSYSPDTVLATFDYDAGAGWVLIGNTSSPTGTFPWDTTGVDAVGVVLRAWVENAALMTNQTTVTPIEIDNTAPTIAIGTITDDQATAGTVTIAYTTAADVARVDFTYFDGAWQTVGTDLTIDGTYVWSPGVAINGVTLRAVATDEVGLSGADAKQGVGTRIVGTNPPAIAAIPTLYVRVTAAYDLNLTFYLSDPDTPLSGLAVTTSDPANVTAFAGAYPSLRVTYAAAGTYNVTLWVSDGTDTAWRIVRVIASGTNPPVLLAPLGTVTFDEDTVLSDALGVLTTRFFDADGDNLTFTVLGAAVISWRLNPNETLDLWASADWFGSEIVRVRASDPSGGFAEAPLVVVVRPVNDAPVLAVIAPLRWTRGESRTLDLTPYVSDVDTPLAQLIVTTDSTHVRVNGLVLTMAFPSNWTEAQFTVSVSDGPAQASQLVRVTLLPGWWNPMYLLLLPVSAFGLVIGVMARRARWRPAKAFLVDDRNELIREFTMDTACEVTWEQVSAAGALQAVDEPVKISKYRAQTVRGDALGLVLLAYGPVNHEQIEFAREMLVNIQGKFEDRLNTRLEQNREFESQVRTLHEELQSKREAFETRSRAFAGMFDAWTTAQTKMAAESVSIRATLADVESREESLIEGGHNLDRERATLRKEREEFTALADRLKQEMDRRTVELENREDVLGTMDSKVKEERKSFDTLRQEKMQRLASMDVEIEAKAKSFEEREAAVKSQAEENARLLSDLAAREETLEIEGDRVERLRQEVDQRKAQTDVTARGIDARVSAVRDQEARKSEEYRNLEATLESRESVLREQEKAFQSQMMNLHETASAKQQMLDGREGKVGELESKIRAEADRIKKTVDDFGKREQAAQDALRDARALKAESDAAHDALERRSMELDEREASLGSEVERRRAEVVRMEQAMKVSEGDLISRRAEVETAERFLDRQMDEIHEATRNVTSRETDVAATERDREGREAKLAARTTDLATLERDLSGRRSTIEEESSRLARGQVDFEARRREFEARVASADATLRDLSNREREVVGRENAYKARETALQSRESEFLRREMTFRDRESQFDHVLRGIEQREAVLAARTAKIDEELRTATSLREEAKSEKENTEQAKTAADAQQAEVARTMKFLQKKAVDILDREEQLRKREKKLEETERILDSQVEIVETQRTAIEVERSESGSRISRLQAEIERMRAIVADADRPSAARGAWSPEAEKDIENRLKIIQQKAFALLDREERLREREEELNTRERLITHR